MPNAASPARAQGDSSTNTIVKPRLAAMVEIATSLVRRETLRCACQSWTIGPKCRCASSHSWNGR